MAVALQALLKGMAAIVFQISFFMLLQLFDKVDDSFSSNGATKVRCKNDDAKENVRNLLWCSRYFI